MKKDAYWFKHDSNSQDDPKLMMLMDQMGLEGIGIFWCLIEKLRNEANLILPLKVCIPYAKRWYTSVEKVETVIKNYNLFVVENEMFFSERLRSQILERSEKARESINYRWGNTTVKRTNTKVIRNDTIREEKRRKENTILPSAKKNTKPNSKIDFIPDQNWGIQPE